MWGCTRGAHISWTARTITAIRTAPLVPLFLFVVAAHAGGQSVRDHVRITPDRSTIVSEQQATELTLTVTEAAVRPIQIWVPDVRSPTFAAPKSCCAASRAT